MLLELELLHLHLFLELLDLELLELKVGAAENAALETAPEARRL